jgi:alcohol dehydrogenase
MIFLFHDFSRALAAGAKAGVTDRAVCALGKLPFRGPFPYGHECIAEVLEVGAAVTKVRVGQHVVVPWAVSCGDCPTCKRGHTSKCELGAHVVSGYGFGDPTGGWGGMVSDLLRVPFADSMLFSVPAGIDPISIASASDNIPDAWRTVAPHLARYPGAPTLVMGGNAKSIGLYAAAIAVAMKSSRVDYLDTDRSRLELAASLGANAVELTPRASWFRRGEPVRKGGYAISVDASNSMSALRYAVRALAPGGVCTSVGFYFWDRTGLPLWQMYLNESTFHIGLSNPAADLPDVLELVTSGAFQPARVTSHVSAWNDAHEAFLVPGTKAVVDRAPLGLAR